MEPDNAAAAALLARLPGDGAAAPVTTLGEERRINAFFRLQRPTIVDRLRQRFPDLPAAPTPRQVFLKLRELRNAW